MHISNDQKMILLAIFIITAGVIFYLVAGQGLFTSTVPESGEVAATVNGEKIFVEELEDYSFRVLAQTEPGQEPNLHQLLDELINEKLIMQDAVNRGVEISKADVDLEYDELVAQFESEESFLAVLNQENMTVEYLKTLIYRSLVIEEYGNVLIKEKPFVVTEEEIASFYDGLAASFEDMPREMIEEQFTREEVEENLKRDALFRVMDDALQILRVDAEIEIFI